MKAHVYVTLKQEVLDPQGDAVRRALGTLGFSDVKIQAVLRYIEAVEQITGQPFVPNLEDPGERMRRNLRAEFGAKRIDG